VPLLTRDVNYLPAVCNILTLASETAVESLDSYNVHWDLEPRAGAFSLSSFGGEGRGEEAVFLPCAERFIDREQGLNGHAGRERAKPKNKNLGP